MLHHRNHSNDGSNRRSSSQGGSSLEKIRRNAPRFGHKKDIEWNNVINPYKDVVQKNIAWVAERPSCADELLKLLQTGVDLMEKVKTIVEEYESASKKLEEFKEKAEDGKDSGDRDNVQQAFDIADMNLRAAIAEVRAAYHDNNLKDGVLYGFGRHTLSDQRGPEAEWLRQFYEYTYKLLGDRQIDSDAAKKATAALKVACDIQKSIRNACHSRSQVAEELFRKLRQLKKEMDDVNNANGDMDALYGLESQLEQIDREAIQVQSEVNSKQKELGEALGTPGRLWKENHPVQDQKKSKSRSKALVSTIKRLSGCSKESTHTRSTNSLRGRS
ncbi:uncharacterized protein FOMMEDRAFT_162345 [Fomitiporia mediterranea MF3/22]|uniref:uncharacterized protein n=1 Tax=Fomitiporia mediterranea (strain MF3/22) TaxID=694068 RepID=UPI0004408F4A|nr:uncharacterized protein FOMMEDRAFT_162345 [Fomitiporia mediterranea MF3/22]EJC98004.1 hypothetical protein FOMMEDRAFT_162345 [Fomitiporia mediterranea MF3/22]